MANILKLIQQRQQKIAQRPYLYDQVENLKRQLRQEDMSLSQSQKSKEEELAQKLQAKYKKIALKLSTIAEYTKLAERQVESSKNALSKEWLFQKAQLTQLFNHINEPKSDQTGTPLPPRLLSLPWKIFVGLPVSVSNANADYYSPQISGLAPGIVRVGELLVEQVQPPAVVPALIPIRALSNDSSAHQPGHIAIFSSDAESRQAAVAAIESIALRVISTFPVRKLKGIFIDPVSMGDNFPFKKLNDFISGQKTYTRSDDVREQVRSLTEHVEQVIQNYLGRSYETIENYNQAMSSIEEAYRYLFIADFPTSFDNNSWEDLKSLLVNGARAGVYVVLHIDESLERPKAIDYSLLESYCTVLRPTFGLNVGAKPQIGNVYIGCVTSIMDTGAYVEFLPGIEGFVPSSKLAPHRVTSAEDVVDCDQRIVVKVRSIDSQGNPELSCLDIHPDEATLAKQKYLRSASTHYQNEPLFEMKLPNGIFFNVKLDSPPDSKKFNQIIESINAAIKKVKIETVPFTQLYPEGTKAWTYDSRREIRSPIGLMGAMDKLDFWMGENEEGLVASQALLAGKPGAGKSYTLHGIIIGLAMRYDPDELEMYLLDFKEGVEFQIYVDPERAETTSINDELNEDKALPHAKVVSIESDREFGLSVLQSVQDEIKERGSKFKSAGVSSLKDYRTKTNEKMSRILVVIDEFQYMFQETDHITRELNLIFEDITRRGRAFGVHLLIASQSPSVPNMSNRIYSFIEVRMAQQMDKNTAASVLAEGNTDAIDLLDRPGKLIYNKDFGRRNHNDIGQVADISLETRIDALKRIQSTVTERQYKRLEPLILFNGSRATRLSQNRQLRQLSEMSQWLSLKDLNKKVIQEEDWIVPETPGVAWLGEAMKIGEHTKAIFRRRPRSNMLLVGTSEEMIFGILGGILLSLVHCYEPKTAQFNIIDLSLTDNDYPWAEMSMKFRDAFTRYFPTVVGKRFPEPDQEILRAEDVLQQTYQEFERRQKQRDENPDELNLGQSLFFVYAIGGLNRAQNLRPVMGRRSEEASPDAQKLFDLISKGAELGIHTILWLDDLKTFLKVTGDNRSWLTHFDLRVGLTMPGDDSRLLLGESYAQNLPRLRAYFRDDSQVTGLEKFKPYAVPTVQDIAEYSKHLATRKC